MRIDPGFVRAFVVSLFIGVALFVVTKPEALPVSPPDHVTDNVGFISADTRILLNDRLKKYEEKTGHQVWVWIGATRAKDLPKWTTDVFNYWGVGRFGHDDGVVLFILPQTGDWRITVGYGLEKALPDSECDRIILETVRASLRDEGRDSAVRTAVESILTSIEKTK
jgi:uncharacterized protein